MSGCCGAELGSIRSRDGPIGPVRRRRRASSRRRDRPRRCRRLRCSRRREVTAAEPARASATAERTQGLTQKDVKVYIARYLRLAARSSPDGRSMNGLRCGYRSSIGARRGLGRRRRLRSGRQLSPACQSAKGLKDLEVDQMRSGEVVVALQTLTDLLGSLIAGRDRADDRRRIDDDHCLPDRAALGADRIDDLLGGCAARPLACPLEDLGDRRLSVVRSSWASA